VPLPRPAAPGLSRRGFLLAMFAGVTAAAGGCTVARPRVDQGISPSPASPRPSGSPRPSPAPTFPGAAAAAEREQAVADLCAALLARGEKINADGRRRLRSVRDGHDAHAAALRSPDPLARPAGPVPDRDPDAAAALRGLSVPAALALLVRRERSLARRHRASAASAQGPTALLWGSLTVAAEAYGRTLDGGGPAVARVPEPAPIPLLSEVEAPQTLVAQLHAVVYGYQLALGQLTGRPAARARSGLRDVHGLRDSLVAALTARSAPVPVAEPAYVPSPEVRDAATATELLRRIETALLPFCGIWLAAAGPADGPEALAALSDTARRGAGWGARPGVWPGWPD